jgi:hypothetical protein
MAQHFTNATCPNCQTYFDRVPVEGDGVDFYAALEITPCAECGALLCACCERFACDACGETFCTAHETLVDELRCCTACAEEVEAQPLPADEMPASHCVDCERPLTLADSRTNDVFGEWHTRCWNAAVEAAKAYQAERDDSDGFAWRYELELAPPKPIRSAVVVMPATDGSEVA